MKIKVRPEDFVVEEAAEIPLREEGDFSLFLLDKKGWSTVDLLQKIARDAGIPFTRFSYGGKKDRHALTKQFVTIRGIPPGASAGRPTPLHFIPYPGEIKADGYSLTFLGFTERPMGPDLITGNRFVITVRDLGRKEADRAVEEARIVGKEGFENYFDDQRFGSYDPRQGFVAEKILKGHYNGALKIYLTHIRPHERKAEKERKRFFSGQWGDWQTCLGKAETPAEKEFFGHLRKNPKGFVPLLQKIPREEMALFFSAYQSYLWNEVLRGIIMSLQSTLLAHRGLAGDYLFCKSPVRGASDYLKRLDIPTPASQAMMPDATTQRVYEKVLRDNHLRPALFNNRKIRQAFFKSTVRSAVVLPADLSARSDDDELYRGKRKLVLAFVLPRGSYGTMLVKRLFSGEASLP